LVAGPPQADLRYDCGLGLDIAIIRNALRVAPGDVEIPTRRHTPAALKKQQLSGRTALIVMVLSEQSFHNG